MKSDEILVTYWREESDELNFGENIAEAILNGFGYKLRTHENALRMGEISKYDSCLLMVGTWVCQEILDKIKTKKLIVWGDGAGAEWSTPIKKRSLKKNSKLDIRAVRGPFSLRSLGLNPKTPVGDPGFLMPLFYPLRRGKYPGKIIYQPHWENRRNVNDKLANLGADKYLDIFIKKDQFLNRIEELISAKFVLTNSLHTAIILHAYNTPWALCISENDKLNSPCKWRDVFEFLGIHTRIRFVENYEEGLEWWNEVGSKAKVPNLIPLIKAFPYPIKNRTVYDFITKIEDNQ